MLLIYSTRIQFELSKKITKSTRRIALSLQYDGSTFCGWQRQKSGLSIQEVLENAIGNLDSTGTVKTFAAGRTDAGVHAAGQVVHFDTCGPIASQQWANALNGRLPKTIRVIESVEMPCNWHACYSATFRRYRYTIYNGCKPNLFLSNWSWHLYKYLLDVDLMWLALQRLVGFYDFSAFQRSGSNRKNAFTTIQSVDLERQDDLVSIEIQASGFLYGMVRLLVGQLVALGEHRLSFETFERRWQQKRREEVKESAPAKGLCFLQAGYALQPFSKPITFDSLPKYSLSRIDPPPPPPNFP